jgi:hypothetical protein
MPYHGGKGKARVHSISEYHGRAKGDSKFRYGSPSNPKMPSGHAIPMLKTCMSNRLARRKVGMKV